MMMLTSEFTPQTGGSALSIRLVRALVEATEQLGISRARLLDAAQFESERLVESEGRVTRAEFYRLCELALEQTADPALGLHMGESTTKGIFNIVGYMVEHAASLRQALQCLSSYHLLLCDDLGFELIERGQSVTLRCERVVDAPFPVRRLLAEFSMTGFLRMLRIFSSDAHATRVNFRHAAPPYLGEYARIFRGSERFEQPFTEIIFDRTLMETQSPIRDDDLHRALCTQAERRILGFIPSTSYSERMRQLLAQQSTRRFDVNRIARQLGLSLRSLRRRLEAEGTSYNEVVNDTLALVAKRLLTDEQRTIQETAFAMGYSDSTAFHRAFKRWTGTTPLEFLKGL